MQSSKVDAAKKAEADNVGNKKDSAVSMVDEDFSDDESID